MISGKLRFFIFLCFLIVCFSLFMSYINGIVRPILYSQTEAFVKTYLTSSVSEALMNEDLTNPYLNSVDFIYSDDGSLSAYSSNIVSANRIRALVSENIINSTDFKKAMDFTVSVGTLSGIPFLYGIGPRLSVKLTALYGITCDISSEFSNSGINQTLHRVILNISAETAVKEPLSGKKIRVDTTIPISETVIVGDVPEAYTVIIRAYQEDEDDINDYAASVN